MDKAVGRLEERIGRCKRWLERIGTMDGMEIVNLLDTRDSIEYSLYRLDGAREKFGAEIDEIDEMLRCSAEMIGLEIAKDAFPRDARRPPRTHWWWYLDQESKGHGRRRDKARPT